MNEVAKRGEFDFGVSISDMMMIVMMILMASLLTTTTTAYSQAAQSIQAQSFTGLTDSRVLEANRFLQWVNLVSDPPYTPWVSASFYNDGPHSVFISINNPDELTEIDSGGSMTVNMVGGDRRIEFIFYKCSAGETASVRAIGKY